MKERKLSTLRNMRHAAKNSGITFINKKTKEELKEMMLQTGKDFGLVTYVIDKEKLEKERGKINNKYDPQYAAMIRKYSNEEKTELDRENKFIKELLENKIIKKEEW